MSLNGLIFVGLMILDVAQASTKRLCTSALTPNLSKMVARQVSLKPLHRDSGLPQSNRNSVIGITDDKVYPTALLMQSDLGPSQWRGDELDTWLALEYLFKDPNLAAIELTEISSKRNYCTPGLSESLCHAIRESRKLRKQAVAQTDLNREETGDQTSMEKVLYTLQVGNTLHQKSNLLEFAWGRDLRRFPHGMGNYQAAVIIRMLVREALIRHLVFEDLDGKTRKGSDLPIETRVMIASAPQLVSLMPFFHKVPLDLPDYSPGNFVFGDSVFGSEIELVKSLWPDLGGQLVARLDLEASSFQAFRFYLWVYTGEGEGLTSEDAEWTKANALKDLNELAAEFQIRMKLKSKIEISGEWEDDSIVLKAKGLSKLDQILFYYFVAEKISI